MKILHLILMLVYIQTSYGQEPNGPIPPGIPIPINAPPKLIRQLVNRIKEINIKRMKSPITQPTPAAMTTTTFIPAVATSIPIPDPIVRLNVEESKPALIIPSAASAIPNAMPTVSATIQKSTTLENTMFTDTVDAMEIKALNEDRSINSETLLESPPDATQQNSISDENRMEPVSDDQDNQTISKDKLAIIVVSVAVIAGVLIVGLIYIGLPKYKNWRKQHDRQSDYEFNNAPDWHQMNAIHKFQQSDKHDLIFR